MKWCGGCARHLSVEHFWRNRRTRDGHQDWCIWCMRAYRAKYREIERAQDNERNHRRRHRNAMQTS